MNIQSILRHWFVLAATALTGWLVLPAEQQAELHKAFGDLIGPVTVILTLVVTAAWRLAIAWLGKLLGHASGETAGSKMNLLVTWLGLAAALGTALPSCATSTAKDGTVTRKPDTESLSMAQSIATLALAAWQSEKAADRAQDAAHRNTPTVERRAAK